MKAAEIAVKAASLVSGDREAQHGTMDRNFGNIARLWSAYLASRREPATELSALDVGHMMVLLKIARTQLGSVNPEDYVDACGYAACAGEIALPTPPGDGW